MAQRRLDEAEDFMEFIEPYTSSMDANIAKLLEVVGKGDRTPRPRKLSMNISRPRILPFNLAKAIEAKMQDMGDASKLAAETTQRGQIGTR